MSYKKLAILLAISSALISTANAQDYRTNVQRFTDYGNVISVTPQYKQTNNPRQVCSDNQNNQSKKNGIGYTGAAIGGVTGGLLGSQIGGGNGRTAATAVTAVIGAVVGSNIQNNQQSNNDRNCQYVDNYSQVQNGYLVEYEYRGQRNTVVTRVEPRDNRIPLSVQALPE